MSKFVRRGKKPRLTRANVIKMTHHSDLPQEYQKKELDAIKAYIEVDCLESLLSTRQEGAEQILKSHNKPYEYPDYLVLMGNDSKEDFQVSYAADILFNIQQLRRWVEIGNAKEIALAAIRLGEHCALLLAENAYEAKKKAGSQKSERTRKGKKEERRGRLTKITTKLGFRKNDILSREQKKTARNALREKYPKYKDKPSNETLNDDLEEIGFK